MQANMTRTPTNGRRTWRSSVWPTPNSRGLPSRPSPRTSMWLPIPADAIVADGHGRVEKGEEQERRPCACMEAEADILFLPCRHRHVGHCCAHKVTPGWSAG